VKPDHLEGDRMIILLSTLAIAFAAFSVWLTVRIVNRRERWAKWMLAVVLVVPVLYVASFGPACWMSSRTRKGNELLPTFYRPIVACLLIETPPIGRLFRWYADLCSAKNWGWFRVLHTDDNHHSPWMFAEFPPPA
jgi:hypothetical protein